jgi:hypothetical protein
MYCDLQVAMPAGAHVLRPSGRNANRCLVAASGLVAGTTCSRYGNYSAVTGNHPFGACGQWSAFADTRHEVPREGDFDRPE